MTTSSIESLVAHLTLAGDDGNVPPGWEATLAERLRELFRDNDSDLKQASADLRDSGQRLIKALEPSARAEVLGTCSTALPEVKKVYLLGKLDFAQLFVSQAASRRTDQSFRETLENPTYRRYVHAMRHGEPSTNELAKKLGRTPEQTSRTLNVLRKAGVSDFRKVATHVFNFLTPAAERGLKRILEREHAALASESAPDVSQQTHDALAHLMQGLNHPVLRSTPTFAGPSRAMFT